MSLRGTIKRRIDAALAPLARSLAARGVQPNQVSLAGAAVAVSGAVPAATGHFTIAAVLFLLGSAVDALDGVLARHHGRETRFGAVLDATLDRIGEGALWIALVIFFAGRNEPLWAGASALAMLTSLLTSYLRAWGERFGAPMAADWLTRPERVLVLGGALLLGRPELAAALVGVVAGVGFGARLWRLARTI